MYLGLLRGFGGAHSALLPRVLGEVVVPEEGSPPGLLTSGK